MTLEVVLIIVSSISLLFSSITVGFSIKALIEVKAMQKSTHSLEYVPVDQDTDRENEAFLAKDKESWASSDKAITKQNEMFKDDLEEKLPEFVLSDEDKEVFSI
jgi:hypothetical protein